MHIRAILKKEALNLKESNNGYMAGFRGRKGKGKMLQFIISSFSPPPHLKKEERMKESKERRKRQASKPSKWWGASQRERPSSMASALVPASGASLDYLPDFSSWQLQTVRWSKLFLPQVAFVLVFITARESKLGHIHTLGGCSSDLLSHHHFSLLWPLLVALLSLVESGWSLKTKHDSHSACADCPGCSFFS